MQKVGVSRKKSTSSKLFETVLVTKNSLTAKRLLPLKKLIKTGFACWKTHRGRIIQQKTKWRKILPKIWPRENEKSLLGLLFFVLFGCFAFRCRMDEVMTYWLLWFLYFYKMDEVKSRWFMIHWNEQNDNMISCDDFVKMNGVWWIDCDGFWENEWGRDIVGNDDFEKWTR